MSEYSVSGTFQGREDDRTFSRVVEAPNESVAREHTYALFGAEHNLKRPQVTIDEIVEAGTEVSQS